MHRGAWRAPVQKGHKELDTTESGHTGDADRGGLLWGVFRQMTSWDGGGMYKLGGTSPFNPGQDGFSRGCLDCPLLHSRTSTGHCV